MFPSARARDLRSEIDHAIEREVQIDDLVGRDRVSRAMRVTVSAPSDVEIRMNADRCAQEEQDDDQWRHALSITPADRSDRRLSARTQEGP